jgi:hypothetical protein
MRINCCFNRLGTTSIRVGTYSNPNSNTECKSIDRDGVFVCNSALPGTNVGLTRIAVGLSDSNIGHFSEIRAYTWVPFDESNSTLSAYFMPNESLINSFHIEESLPTGTNALTSVGGLKTDTLFSTGPAVNCWWMMNLGSSMHIKVVLIIGDYSTKENTRDWILTVGNDPNPLLNP